MNQAQLLSRSLFGLLLLLIVTVATCKNYSKEPERPASVPQEAFWLGGPDGGVFVVIQRSPKDPSHMYQASIFYPHGEIWYAGPLIAEGNDQLPVDIENREIFIGWDGETLILSGGRSLRPPRKSH